MATPQQIEANRRNSQASTGPRTAAGKAHIRFNALQSGIDAKSQLIPGEDPEVLQTFAAEFTASCNPAGAREQELVDQMIDDAWRLRRLRKAETQQWAKSMARLEAREEYSAETRVADACWNCEASLTHIQRMVASIKRSFHQASVDLDRLQAARAKMQEQSQSVPPDTAVPTLVPTRQPVETKPMDPPDAFLAPVLPEMAPVSPTGPVLRL
jgi:hypothetical protein